MQLQDFLACVLPGAGLRVICHPAKRGFRHHFLHTDLEASNLATELDSKGSDVYFGCASYQTDESRKAENVRSVRSFWLDIDAGPNKPYATGLDAAKAALAFADLLGIPRPLLVSSGKGIHAYWPMEADMVPDDWLRVAEKLKLVSTHADLQADTVRTADIASVLRPVGTHHRKAEPRLVKVVHPAEPFEMDELEAALDRYIEHNSVETSSPFGQGDDLNDDLSGGMDRRDCDADQLAAECAVLRLVRDTKGNVDQPTWYHTLQILAYCTDGEQLAHEWSRGHKDYTAEETTKKFTQAGKHKPTTCKRFSEIQPSLCQQCPHFGAIKSPVSVQKPAPPPPQTITTSKGGYDLPDNYSWDDKMLRRVVKVRDGEGWKEETVDIADTVFYLVDRYNLDEDGMAYQVEYLRQGEYKYFTITGACIAKGGGDLLSELGKHEITSNKPNELQMYLKAWMNKQKELLAEKKMHQHFGWQDATGNTDFLLGDKLYRPGLGATEVLLKGGAKKRGRDLVTRGSYDRWKEIIERAYNHDGLESLQFLVMCGFAAPLFSLFGDLGGTTVYAYSGKTGKGKTTACQAALSVWGNWREMMTAHERVTVNAFWSIIGTYHTLPVLYDELTNMEPHDASQLVFGMTDGQPKQRLKANGEELDNNSSWRTILLTTGNNQLSEKLASNRANPEAEIARLFEFPAWAKHEVDAKEAVSLFRDLLENYGHAGVDFVSYITDSRTTVINRLIEWRGCIIDDMQMTTQERYWSALFASIMCALEICRIRGILNFPMRPLYAWIKSQLAANRGTQTTMASDPKHHFSRMLADQASGIIETKTWGNLVKGEPAQLTERRPSGPIVGRLVANEEKLYISVDAVREWCVKRKISHTEMMKEVIADGWVAPEVSREALGRGTAEYASVVGRLSVYVVDMGRVDAVGSISGERDVIAGGRSR